MKTDFKILEEELAILDLKLDSLVGLMKTQNHLQRVALLGPDRVFRFNHRGQTVSLHLPDAEIDGIQRIILQSGQFFEADLLDDFAKRGIIAPQSVVYDVGANIGNHSVYFAHVLGAQKVVSFEPQPHCFTTLERNIALNALPQVQPVHAMVGAQAGQGAVAHFKASNHGATRLEESADGTIPMLALDEFATQNGDTKIDFMKIDVEGQSFGVLEGAREILKTHRPVLWIELLPRFKEVEPAVQFLSELGYRHENLSRLDFLFTPT